MAALALIGLTAMGEVEAQADSTPPAAPTGVSAMTSSSGIALDWTDNAENDLAGYDVYRSENSAGPYNKLNSTLLNGSSYFDAAATPGIISYYTVFALDNSGNISPPAAISAGRPFDTIKWSSAAPTSLKRDEGFGAFVNGKLYTFGGYYGDPNFTPTRRADVFDPATNAWTPLTNLPKGLSHVGVAVAGDLIYLAGGYPAQIDGTGQNFSSATVYRYNTKTNKYSTIPHLPLARAGGILVCLDRTLHYFGGSDRYRKDSGTHWAFNLDTGTAWVTRAPMPTPRNHLGGAALNGKVYAVGGQSGQDAAAIYRDNVDAYDPATDTWAPVASLPQVRSHHNASTFELGGRIVAVGGESAYSGARLANVTAYDPATNLWTELTPVPVKRTAGITGATGGVIYQTTGSQSTTTYKGVPVAP